MPPASYAIGHDPPLPTPMVENYQASLQDVVIYILSKKVLLTQLHFNFEVATYHLAVRA